MGSGHWQDWRDVWDRRRDRKWESFSWLAVRALLSSVNDVVGKGAPRLVNDLRGAWVAKQREVDPKGRWDEDFIIRVENAGSVLLLGDPGEQDVSQYVVVPVLLSQDDADFMIVMSDVIYPSGDVNDYVDGFYVPYRDLDMPIFGLPGNHDWYDGLDGFMWNFCGAEALPPEAYDVASYRMRDRIARRLWKKASAPNRDVLNAYRNERLPEGERWEATQPGPYYAIEMDDLLLVCVDSGITGGIDREQAEWLVRVSESTTKPKVMIVGRPLVDKKCHKPGPFPEVEPPVDGRDGTTFATVDEVARYEPYGYVAAIGGDTHNYQRYDVTLQEHGASRPFHYVVSGGGGAYMSATHTIPGDALILDAEGDVPHDSIDLLRFDCYPSRVESLGYFAALVVPRLWRLVVRIALVAAGLASTAVAVLVFGISNETLDVLVAMGAAAVGVELLFVFFGPDKRTRSTEPTRLRRFVTYLSSMLLGAVLGLAIWWLSPEHFGRHMIAVGTVAAMALLIAELLRKTGIWRTKWVGVAFLIGQVVLAIAVLAALLVLNDADEIHLVLIVITPVFLVALLMGIDRLRVLYPKRYKILLRIGLGAAVGLAAWQLDASWARAIATAAVVGGVGLVLAALAHLHFLNAFSLFYRPTMRNGTLSKKETEQVIHWRDRGDDARPTEARIRRIGDMVYPGTTNPRGPLHRFVSEIFDKDDPPLFKNFLRLDVGDETLTITCFHATGLEAGPADVTCEDPIEISLPSEPARSRGAGAAL
jgi:hypothetical protein